MSAAAGEKGRTVQFYIEAVLRGAAAHHTGREAVQTAVLIIQLFRHGAVPFRISSEGSAAGRGYVRRGR